jgi:glutathione S-transferase
MSEATDTPERTSRRHTPLWETVAILLAIASLWPAYVLPALGGEPADEVWLYVSYVMLALMAVIFIRRIAAFRRLAREQEEARRDAENKTGKPDGGRVRLPWEPDE